MVSLVKIYDEMRNERDGKERFAAILSTVDDFIHGMKGKDPEAYDKLKMSLYIDSQGYHFNDELLEHAYAVMVNDDGSKAPYFPLDDCEKLARRNNIRFQNFNEYDFAYTMNMLYSDYCQVLGTDGNIYAKMALKFLDDPDAPDGGSTKALRYYLSVHPKL